MFQTSSFVVHSVLALLVATHHVDANPLIRRQAYTCGTTSDNSCLSEFNNNPIGTCEGRCVTDSGFRDTCEQCCSVCFAASTEPTQAPVTSAPTPTPSTSPTAIHSSCGDGTNSDDCIAEFDNTGLGACVRCTDFPLFRSRCQLCCDSCWPTPAPTPAPTPSPTPAPTPIQYELVNGIGAGSCIDDSNNRYDSLYCFGKTQTFCEDLCSQYDWCWGYGYRENFRNGNCEVRFENGEVPNPAPASCSGRSTRRSGTGPIKDTRIVRASAPRNCYRKAGYEGPTPNV